MIRRLYGIQDEGAGLVKDLSDLILRHVSANPYLITDLAKDRSIFLFSDYSRVAGHYDTYAFLVTGRHSAERFNAARKLLRREFNIGKRRMSFKGMNDRRKLTALPAFLSIAAMIDGYILTICVDRRIRYIFADNYLVGWPELATFKKHVLESLLRIVHFGVQALALGFYRGQNVVWVTDNDQVVEKEEHRQLFGRLATVMASRFIPANELGCLQFGLAEMDNGSLEVEDLLAIPDLVAGATCELLDRLATQGVRVPSKLALPPPRGLTLKTSEIFDWMTYGRCPLKRLFVVFDRFGAGPYDFRPTIFSIEKQKKDNYAADCPIDLDHYPADPIKFDDVE